MPEQKSGYFAKKWNFFDCNDLCKRFDRGPAQAKMKTRGEEGKIDKSF
jgi:hypothetical protein